MPEYEIRFRLKDREDLPAKTCRNTASDPETARREFLAARPRAIICGAPLLVQFRPSL